MYAPNESSAAAAELYTMFYDVASLLARPTDPENILLFRAYDVVRVLLLYFLSIADYSSF